MNGKYYKHINLNAYDIRNDKYSKPIPIQNDTRYNYMHSAKSIGLRVSIEHCELHGVIKGLTTSLENCKNLKTVMSFYQLTYYVSLIMKQLFIGLMENIKFKMNPL